MEIDEPVTRSAMPLNIDTLRQSAIPLTGVCSGKYVLFFGDELVCEGESWNCFLRVAENTKKDCTKRFTSWNFVPFADGPERKALGEDKLRQTAIPLRGVCSGIYVLFDSDELVYVGEGWNCLLRVAEHTRKESTKSFTSWNFLPVTGDTERKAVELELRTHYKPKYNRR